MAALMRWACQRMISLPTAMPVAHAPPRWPRCSRPMPRATPTRPTPPCAPRWPRCTAWRLGASWWRAARLNSSTASPPGRGCKAWRRCCCPRTATATTLRPPRPMGWPCGGAGQGIWMARTGLMVRPPPCSGPASPPARWARSMPHWPRGMPPLQRALAEAAACVWWTAPTAPSCWSLHTPSPPPLLHCPHRPGSCGHPTKPWA